MITFKELIQEGIQSRFSRAKAKEVTEFAEHKHLRALLVGAVQTYTGAAHHFINKPLYRGDTPGTFGPLLKKLDAATTTFRTKAPLIVHSGVKYSPERHLTDSTTPVKMRLPAYTSTSIVADKAHYFSQTDPNSRYNYFVDRQFDETTGKTKIRAAQIPFEAHKEYQQSMTSGDPYKGIMKLRGIANELGHGGSDVVNYRHMIAIHVPEGSHGLYVKEHSRHPSEHEFLLPRHGAETEDGHVVHSHIEVHPRPIVDHSLATVFWKAKLIQTKVKKENNK